MFIKSVLAKFEWSGQPEELPDLFIENLLLHNTDYNFAIVNFKSRDPKNIAANGEFWSGNFTVLEYEPKYKRPKRIQVINGMGETFATDDFILFNNFKNTATLNSSYINYYSQMIKQINAAIEQHITASQLVATIYASNQKEKADLERLFSDFNGVKIYENKSNMPDFSDGKKINIVQFEIEPRLKELEDLKHDIEKDLFLRLAIDYGTDKTHITNLNIEDSEQVIDLINAYENKLRQNFCKRYNKWKEGANLTCKIHEINASNTVEKREGEQNDNERF